MTLQEIIKQTPAGYFFLCRKEVDRDDYAMLLLGPSIGLIQNVGFHSIAKYERGFGGRYRYTIGDSLGNINYRDFYSNGTEIVW